MIKDLRPVVWTGVIFFLLLSCKTPPPPEGETGGRVPVAEVTPPEETLAPVEGEPLNLPGDEVSVFLPPEGAFTETPVPLIEPFPDTPEADSPLFPPPGVEIALLFPEPFPPDLPLSAEIPAESPPEPPAVPDSAAPSPGPPAPDDGVQPPAAITELPPSAPPTAAAPNTGSETPPAPPPEPPRFLRPAEPESSPDISREPIPLPVNPPPELPPGISSRIPGGEEDIVYSRVVRATVGQLVEIPFRGSAWVYLGELGSRQGISYDSRRLDPEGQSFVFRAEKAGTYGLKFYKQDFIQDYILNDYVQVIIGEAPAVSGTGWFNPPVDRGRVIAEPRWPALPDTGAIPETAASGTESPQSGISPNPDGATLGVFPAAADQVGSSGAASVDPAGPAPPPLISDEGIVAVAPPAAVSPVRPAAPSPDTTPEGYLRRAREEFDAGRIGSALSVLDHFREQYPGGSDEVWWLYGQLFEANGPNRDIRSALDYYRRLIREYPQSPRYAEARRRIAYLERYYFNIP